MKCHVILTVAFHPLVLATSRRGCVEIIDSKENV